MYLLLSDLKYMQGILFVVLVDYYTLNVSKNLIILFVKLTPKY